MSYPLSLSTIHSLIAENANQSIVLSDEDGKVLYANDSFGKIIGHHLQSGEFLRDIPFADFMRKEDKESIAILYKSSLIGKKKSFSFNVQKQPVNEKAVWYRLTNKAIKTEAGAYYFLHAVEDISLQKRTEEKLNEDKAKAEENDRLKSAFLANMSHEIRTPMNTIIGFTKLLSESEDAEEKEQFAEIVKTSGAHLLRLINDIIDISKIEAGFHDIKLLSTNINELLSDVQKLYMHDKRLTSKHLDLKLEHGLPYLNAHILTDETRLRQVVSNLVDNAIKFTKSGEISFGYKLTSETYNDGTPKLLFFVKDRGIGISKENQKMIFERFHQVDGESKKMGTGLGLTIVKTLTKKLGGDIWLESVLGKGTTFYFTLPYLQKKQEKEEVIRKVDMKSPNFENKVILIAEDIISNYQYLEALLRKTKAELIWAKNGKDAVKEVLSERKIDLVLMDLRMPVMNGYNATKQIKLVKPKLPVLAVTAYAIDGDMEKAFDFGCDDYITKPIAKVELFKKIEVFLT
jgi:PAS domain S-box-containing protein